MAVFPFDASKMNYNPEDPSQIDPSREYPKDYEEFMTREGTWDLYGTYHYAFDGNTDIDEAKVAEIMAAREQRLMKKQKQQLEKLEKKMQAQIELRFEERRLLDHEVDTTSIEQMFKIYHGLGGLGAESMLVEIIDDLAELEEIVGPLSYDNMEMLKSQNPNFFGVLLVQIWNWLGYLAKIPIKDEDGNDTTMNLYRKALDTLIEKNLGPNGEKPGWL